MNGYSTPDCCSLGAAFLEAFLIKLDVFHRLTALDEIFGYFYTNNCQFLISSLYLIIVEVRQFVIFFWFLFVFLHHSHKGAAGEISCCNIDIVCLLKKMFFPVCDSHSVFFLV